MPTNRIIPSDELITEVATWLEKVAIEGKVTDAFRENTTTTGVTFLMNPRTKVKTGVGVIIPLDRLMRHCNLTEPQALEAIEQASTCPDRNVSIQLRKDDEDGDIVFICKRCSPEEAENKYWEFAESAQGEHVKVTVNTINAKPTDLPLVLEGPLEIRCGNCHEKTPPADRSPDGVQISTETEPDPSQQPP